MALKRVYLVERSSYLYSVRKFLPYPMWDETYIVRCETLITLIAICSHLRWFEVKLEISLDSRD